MERRDRHQRTIAHLSHLGLTLVRTLRQVRERADANGHVWTPQQLAQMERAQRRAITQVRRTLALEAKLAAQAEQVAKAEEAARMRAEADAARQAALAVRRIAATVRSPIRRRERVRVIVARAIAAEDNAARREALRAALEDHLASCTDVDRPRVAVRAIAARICHALGVTMPAGPRSGPG